jgi:hypothetical protein
MDMQRIQRLAALLQERNAVDEKIAGLIERPAFTGHIGEWIAAEVFGIRLQASAINQGSDGHFLHPPLQGRTVNVKLYTSRTNTLDMKKRDLPQPDFYLAMTGPKSTAATSRGCNRPCVIRDVFLFETASLLQRLGNVKVGVATSIREREWLNARIFLTSTDRTAPLQLTPEQVEALRLLGGVMVVAAEPDSAPLPLE